MLFNCRLHESESNTVICRYEISRILFYFRGPAGTADEACFAFTFQNGDTTDSPTFCCHIFRCNIPEAVCQVSSKCAVFLYSYSLDESCVKSHLSCKL